MNTECSNMEKVNIYFVVSHPIQYFAPLYKHIAQNEETSTKVFFLSDETIKGTIDKEFGVNFAWDIPLLEGYDYKFIRNRSLRPSLFNGFWGLFNPGIITELRKLPRGMVVINGWHFSTYILAYVSAFAFGHVVAIRCEAPMFMEKNRVGIKNRIRSFLLRNVLLNRLVDICLYLGKQNLQFYKYYNVDQNKLIFSPYTIDNVRFKQSVTNLDNQRECTLQGLSSDNFVILFTGKFIERKRPMDLIKAFDKLNIPNKKLVLVGDGHLKEDMQKYISTHRIEGVHFTGFINQSELPKYYAIADVLVLCSESETWGLSVNEAMASGLPVIVSSNVGCGDDLIKEGRNGFIFPTGDIESLATALKEVFEAIQKGLNMGLESELIIKDYSIEATADGIVAAVKASLSEVHSKT